MGNKDNNNNDNNIYVMSQSNYKNRQSDQIQSIED